MRGVETFGWPGSDTYGPDGWPHDPQIGTGGIPQMPLAFDFPLEIETPDAQRLWPVEYPESEGAGPAGLPPSLGQLRMYGQLWWPATAARAARDVPDAVANEHPFAAEEAVYWFDVCRCVAVEADELAVAGRVWELARVTIPRYALAVVERVGYRGTVTALDEDGEPLATFVLDGTDPCAVPVTHPDPAVANPLGFRLLLQVSRLPSDGDGIELPVLAAALPNQIPAESPVLDVPDLRYGWAETWPAFHQYITGGRGLLRLLVTLSGDPDRWDVRMMGRLTGYTQQPGRLDAALANATHRP